MLYSTICGAQLNEIAAAKGPDKFLPHLLGHEASARVIEIGPGRDHGKTGRYGGAALATEPGHPMPDPGLSRGGAKSSTPAG